MVRGKQREDAILAATVDLVGEVGYEALTMMPFSAKASKATIYRRWRNKPELVKATLDAHATAIIADTGSLRGDLVMVMRAMSEWATAPYQAMISGLIAGRCPGSRGSSEVAVLRLRPAVR